jgi:hypothetical protein
MVTKRYRIECEMDYDYLKEVGCREINADGTYGIYQELPVEKGSTSRNEYILSIDFPEKEDTKNPIKDIATAREAFIIDELQKYMDLTNPSEPKWINSVRLRLQEKEDWKNKVRDVIARIITIDNEWKNILTKELELQ